MEKTFENEELQKESSDYTFTKEGISLPNAVEKAQLIKYSDIKSMYLSIADTETAEVKAAIAKEKSAMAEDMGSAVTEPVSKYVWVSLLRIPKFHIAKLNMTNRTVSEYLGNDVLFGFLYSKGAFEELLSHCQEHVVITGSVYGLYQVELDQLFVKNQIPFTNRSILQEAQWKRKDKQ